MFRIQGDGFVEFLKSAGISLCPIERYDQQSRSSHRLSPFAGSACNTREQQMRLYEIGGMLYTEALPVSRTSSNNLDRVRIENYLKDITNDPEIPDTEDQWEQRLANLGLLSAPGGMCTIAGMVLFGKLPRQYLKQGGLRVLAFNSTQKEYKAELDTILDAPFVGRWEYAQGSKLLIDKGLIENLLEKIEPFISQESDEIDENFRREKQYSYPFDVFSAPSANKVHTILNNLKSTC